MKKIENRKSKIETFLMPAEWERHEATWIGWPHNQADWPGKFSPIPWVFGEMVRKISEGEIVRLIVKSGEHEKSAKNVLSKNGTNLKNIEFFRWPTDRGWTRDFGPIFVKPETRNPKLEILNCHFNGWAKYPNHKKDTQIAGLAAKRLGKRLIPVEYYGLPIVLEGGAIDVNGRGTLMTTEECLLDQKTQVRNPGLSREDMNKVFNQYFGAKHVIWLNKGIDGDDTHGHVDDLARFVNPTTIVLCQEKNKRDKNHRILEENRERLKNSRFDVVPLPMPAPLYFEGQRLPASYANFYISNACVLVPTFNDPNDRIALSILAELITDRPIVGIHAVDLVWGLGTIHCLTQQQVAYK